MYVWSKKLIFGLLAAFAILFMLFSLQTSGVASSNLKSHTTFWILLNFSGLVIWIFVWMIDQARVRGKNVWLWLLPFLLAPLPTLMVFILFLQRRMKT
ncbi:MAG TPA: hypothetical protein VGQ60_02920 [Nitrospiraceae bacterium]|nr:hypothetical protein [Nitrospiraceae bacterium]